MDSIPAWTPTLNEAAALVPRVARAYGLDLIEWRTEGSGLLLAVGSGLMMATMDAIPSLRWATDIGGGKKLDRLADALLWLDRLVPLIVVHAWFSITAPEPLRSSLPLLRHTRIVARSNVPIGVPLVRDFSSLVASATLPGAERTLLAGTGEA